MGGEIQEQGKLDEAVASYHKALAIKPDYAEAHSNLGAVLQDQGKVDAAIACHRRAITLNPRNGLFWDGFAASDRKSTRLNSSHVVISYAVFGMTKKTMIKFKHVVVTHRTLRRYT